MLAEVGQFALILALLLAAVQAVVPLWGAHRGDSALMAMGRAATLLQAVFVTLAFGALAAAYAVCDFSVALVTAHSHTTQPLAYRLAATWGSHEGSMLLWVLILAFFGALVALFGSNLPATLKANALAVQAWIALLGGLAAAMLGVLKYFNYKSRRDRAASVGASFALSVDALASDDRVKRMAAAILLRRFFDRRTEQGTAGTPYQYETIGVIAARTPCRKITRRSLSPLARAVRM